MNDFLDKKDALLERDEHEQLLPITRELNTARKEKITFTPMPRGEVKTLFGNVENGETTRDQDKEIIMAHCVNPKFTEAEVNVLKPYLVTAIVLAILSASGLKEKDTEKADDAIKKASG